MKKDLIFAAALALAAFSMPSCNNEDEEFSTASQPASSDGQTEQLAFSATGSFSCGDEGLSKVALSGTTLMFSANEAACVDLLNASGTKIATATFTGDNTTVSATTNFKGTVKATDFANTSSMRVTIPSTAVNSDGVMEIPATQALVENGFAPNAFIATDTITDKTDMTATFNAQVALLKIVSYTTYSDVTVNGTGICGVKGNTNYDEITLGGDVTASKIYYVAVWPGTYSDGITIKSGTTTLKTISSATLKAGKYYTVRLRENVTVKLSELTSLGYGGACSSATKIVFDYTDKVDQSILDWDNTSTDNADVTMYSKNNEYYFLSNKNICMSGSCYQMFNDYQSLTTLEFNNFNTESVTNMSYMFYRCFKLTSLDLSKFNTASVTNMASMFHACSGLTSLDLSKFNTASVKDMAMMFYSCEGLTSLDLSKFNTASVTNMSDMFYYCTGLTNLDLSKLNTASVTNMGSMFMNCTALKSLNLSGFNTAKVDDMRDMFCNCTSLTSLDLSSFNTGKVYYMHYMFSGCSSLALIYVGEWNTKKVGKSNNMFNGCIKLVGGNGTVYDSNNTDITYAHLDGGSSNPGYFSVKPSSK